MTTIDLEDRPNRPRKKGATGSDPSYVALRPGALAITQLPAYAFEVEQYRNLALEIEERFDPEDEGSHVLAVVGPDPSSGKTLTSLNLALVLARRTERSVLLVEGDLWKPSFSSLLQLPAEALGVSDLLRDENLKLDDALLSVWGSGLTVLTAGERSGKGDLVTSRRMDELVVTMKSRFDLVVLDTPPIGLASGRYLSGFADSIVIVVRARQTERDSVAATLESLDPETVVGLVLNDVRKRERHYTYYSSYVAYYGKGHENKPVGWFQGFAKRPLAGLATVAGVVGALATSIFAIVRGKPAEAELEPAWIVAGILLILTVTSWAFLLTKKASSENEQAPAVASAFAPEHSEPAGAKGSRGIGSEAMQSSGDRDSPEPVEEPKVPALSVVDQPSPQEQRLAEPLSPERGITITNLNIRRQPALDGDLLATLPRGTSFEVLDQSDDWYLVQAGSYSGWVAKLGTQMAPTVLAATDEPGAAEEFQTSSAEARTNTNLNLRALPGRSGEYLTTLPEGTPLEVLAEDEGWYQVRAGEQVGWVFKPGVDNASPVASVSADPAELGALLGGARTSTNLNLRLTGELTGQYLTTLPKGTDLELLERRGDWYRVRAGDQAGWVSKTGVVFDKPVPSGFVRLDDLSGPPESSQAQSSISVQPKFLSWKAPSFSATEVSHGQTQTVVASVHVAATGAVLDVVVHDDRRTGGFHDALVESLHTAAFRPAFKDGVAVSAWHMVRVKYPEST